ncbi:hypothetical protein AALO_G00032600 [Alosa alosa]|uniref:HD domain-containing protein n=1 Tax=Alosa alosa TaxID=278164 RepID=A0AAV6HC87_9TELE|nr:deoxynucleoside triphosphate triphosphohydrolase SAMHD1-like [Alosa alosa]KAG5284978.1 hypothetical protein AALO_G00032600 [Alosa alosa]
MTAPGPSSFPADPKEWKWDTKSICAYLKEKLDCFSDSDAKVFEDLKFQIVLDSEAYDDEKVSFYMEGVRKGRSGMEENLQQEGIGPEASFEIIHCIERLWKIPKESKVFNDPIHGHIEIPALLVRIIDTPEFQRLRNIKQLGGTYMVFPGASHNRFEHSLGVAYLAGELVKTLEQNQKELNISERDILCVQIAGLCHDLGHGPFSHLFDGSFKKVLQEQTNRKEMSKWQHEDASVKMLRHLVKKNYLKGVLRLNGLNDLDNDLDFIASLIKGEPKENEKDFLYQIVANKDSGIDVDKWDYFARDSYHLGIGKSFDHERLLKFVQVRTYNTKRHICFREKEVGNLYNMFYTRHLLHCRAYQHPVCNLIEYMIAEAFVAANEHFKIQGSGKKEYILSTAMEDMEAYAKLTDSVFEQIQHSQDERLEKAKKIIQRITCRELYHYIGKTHPMEQKKNLTKGNLVNDLVKKLKETKSGVEFDPKDFFVDVFSVNYGKGKDNPLDNVYFYNKDKKTPFTLKPDMVSLLLPHTFAEQVFRVYYKKRANLETVKKTWKSWITPWIKVMCESTPPRASSKRSFADGDLLPRKQLKFNKSGSEESGSEESG